MTNTNSYIAARMATSPSGVFTASDALFEMDIDGDGHASNGDLQALLNYLKNGGGSISSVPEPGSFVLLTLGGLLLVGRGLHRKVRREKI